MKYYLHDSNAFNDEKITELFIKFGYEGLGLFYTILEKLAQQEKPIKTDVLKSQLKVGKKLNKCWNFMEEIDIISSNNGETFNKQLLNFSEKYKIKKEKNTKRISEWRKNQALSENVTHYEHVRNTPKVKESKVKESKVNIAEASSAKEIPNLLKDEQLHIRIIGLYARAKKIEFKNVEQQRSFIVRNVRPARNLVGYEEPRIIEVMKWLLDNADFKWTLETVPKYIDENLEQLTIKGKTEEDQLDYLLKK